jgi:hypothetical protein
VTETIDFRFFYDPGSTRQKLGNKQNLNYTIKLSATLIHPQFTPLPD